MKALRNWVLAALTMTLFMPNQTAASHAAGMDIFYRWVSDSTYEFTVIFYRNCSPGAIGAPPSVSVRADAPSLSVNNNRFNCARLATTGPGVPPLEPSFMYACTKATLCYEEYVYRGNYTTTSGRARDWTFGVGVNARPNPPRNSANLPNNRTLYVECGLNNKDFPDTKAKNWSPFFHNRRPNHPGYTTDTVVNFLFRTLCAGNFYTFDEGAAEYQGDSLSYEFIEPLQGFQNVIPMINGYGLPPLLNPLPITSATSPLTINPKTGIIDIVPAVPPVGESGIYTLCLKATEWRGDTAYFNGLPFVTMKEIGFVMRDMTIWIDDSTTCRKDSIHIKDTTLTAGCANQVDIYFSSTPSGPNNRVRCETISPDGSEFRLLDSNIYHRVLAATGLKFDTLVRSIGVTGASWTCKTGATDRISLTLAEELNCGKYTVMLKMGTDLDVLESECGFLEPEFSVGDITIHRNVPVSIDQAGPITICLPTTDPTPQLSASSPDDPMGLKYQWFFEGDSIDGQEVNFVHADRVGKYKVQVEDPCHCFGEAEIDVYIDTVPEFVFTVPPYCDQFGENENLPDILIAPVPNVPGGTWEWIVDGIGTIHVGDTLDSASILKDVDYTLRYTKPPMGPGAQSCAHEQKFTYDREAFPPEEPLFVRLVDENLELCGTDSETGELTLWENGLRQTYDPLEYSWFQNDQLMSETGPTIVVQDTGTYKVFVKDGLGCWGEHIARVTHDFRAPSFEIPCQITSDAAIFTWEEVPGAIGYEVSLNGGVSWMPASGGDHHVVTNIVQQQSIVVRARTATACEYTDFQESNQCPDKVFPPNVFTPNEDGLNETFYVRGLDLFPNSTVQIFDRWGNLVFESNNYKNDWNGEGQPDGTYYYIINVDDPTGTVHKGFVTLLR